MLSEKNILYEDESVLIVNKPAGMLTVSTPRKERHTLTSAINSIIQKRGLTIGAYPCYRLDRDTSGLILYAKGKSIQARMAAQFKNGQVGKLYIAFVSGILKRTSGVISFPIENKKAITKYKLLQKRRGYSIIEITPSTGRTNQIRIHFSMIGHALLGESTFAFRRDFKVRFRRVALHACKINFKHPLRDDFLHFYCPLPDDMSRLIGGQIKNL